MKCDKKRQRFSNRKISKTKKKKNEELSLAWGWNTFMPDSTLLIVIQ